MNGDRDWWNGGQRRVSNYYELLPEPEMSGKKPEMSGKSRKYPVKCVRITPARSVPDAVPLIST